MTATDKASRQVSALLTKMCVGLGERPGDTLARKAETFIADPSSGVQAISTEDRKAMIERLNALSKSPKAGNVTAGVAGALADGLSATLEPVQQARPVQGWLAGFGARPRPTGLTRN